MRKLVSNLILCAVLLGSAGSATAQELLLWSVGASGGIVHGENGSAAVGVGQPIAAVSSSLTAGFWGVAGGAGYVLSSEETPGLPIQWEIGNAYPNPFNPSTQVVVSMPQTAQLRAEIYNVLGRRVAVLADGVKPAGVHHLIWDGRGMASGVYFLRTEVPGHMQRMQKVVLIK